MVQCLRILPSTLATGIDGTLLYDLIKTCPAAVPPAVRLLAKIGAHASKTVFASIALPEVEHVVTLTCLTESSQYPPMMLQHNWQTL